MKKMSVSQRQMCEIAKAISYHSKVIVLDEPTSSLTAPEVEKLFKMMRQLKAQGIALIYISHKMDEIFEICDEISVLRDGSLVMTKPSKETDMNELIAAMVGRSLDNRFPPVDNTPGETILSVQNISTKYAPKLQNISFDIKKGEIFGFYGLVGAGRTELLETIFGIRTKAEGNIVYDGKVLNFSSPKDAMDHGFALITEERKANGLFLKGDITFNTTIANMKHYKSGVALSHDKMVRATAEEIKIMHTKCMGPDDMIANLSGGNQQKVIFGKWLERSPSVFMMDDPTRGIDVGAKYEIYELIINMAKQGKTIIVVSSEMPEILGITNRIGVMSNGRLAGIVNTKETNQEELLRLSAKIPVTGGKLEMAENSVIISSEEEAKLLKPIDEYVEEIQKKIDALRADGFDKVSDLKKQIAIAKENKNLSATQRDKIIENSKKELENAKKVEADNKEEIKKLVAEAEGYLAAHYKKDYYDVVNKSCKAAKAEENSRYEKIKADLKSEHQKKIASLKDAEEIKAEKYVLKNKLFDAQMAHESKLQEIKDRRHEAFMHKYHLIDLLRASKFTFQQQRIQKLENYRYTFDLSQFLYKNGLYIVIILIFIALCIITPIVKNTQLLTVTNILNILQQASPRMFLALGVAGLILLTGTDLSVGRMVGMGMVTATIIMHNGINTGAVFGHVFDFSAMPATAKALFALLMCVIFTTVFAMIAGFFMARFKMHPFISTMANMLIIFGLVTYATKGVSFGAIDSAIPNTFIPQIGKFPTIILWAVAAVAIVWFIWNKTTFGKNLYAVGGNPEAAAVSGISVFKVTMGAFMLAGILYGFGSWLECNRMVGSGSAAYGQGWDMDAIAACVVGGVSFTGGIGKISGVVTGVLIFTSLTYALTILGIDTNLQFIFEGIIILAAVTLDCLKYVQKK